MSKHDEHFLPEQVDEQIDALARTQDPPLSSEARLVANLHQIHEEDNAIVELVRVRLATYAAQKRGSSTEQADAQSRSLPSTREDWRKGPQMMKSQLVEKTQKNKRSRFLEILAAVLIVAILVGSMAFLLKGRQSSLGSARSATPTPTSAPAVTGSGGLYVTTSDGIDRIDYSTGNVVWHAGSGLTGNVLIEQNVVIFSGGDTVGPNVGPNYSNYYVEAVNATTGKQLWREPYGNIHSLQGGNGIVYVSSDSIAGPSTLDALKTSTGNRLWVYSSPQGAIWELYQDNIVYGISYANFFALNATTGKPLWQKNLQKYPHQEAIMTPLVSSGAMYFSSCNATKNTQTYGACDFFAFNAASGDELWHIPFGQMNNPVLATPTAIDGVAYVASLDGVIHALSTKTGVSLWTYQTGGMIANPLLSSQGLIYAEVQGNTASSHSHLLALKVTNTSHAVAWSAANPNSFSLGNGQIYLLDSHNNILTFQAENGNLGQSYHPHVGASIGSFSFVWQNAG